MDEKHTTFEDFLKEFEDRSFLRRAFDFVVYRIPAIIHDWKYETEYAFQRAFRGYDDRYWWGHHTAHARITIQALKKLRAERISSPSILFDINTSSEEGHAKWDSILDAMIAGFQASLDIDDVHFTTPDGEFDADKTYAERAKLKKKIDRGLRLYAKYYLNLWD